MGEDNKKIIVAATVVLLLAVFFFLAKNTAPDFLEGMGLGLPLPVFTLIIALLDGFNPCTMWVLTFLLVLLISVSHDRKKIFTIGFTFVAVVYVFYFLFMAAWLNLFFYIGLIDPIRIGIALLALTAGAINCKEYFYFRKGVTLMVQEKHKAPLVKKIERMKQVIKTGSTPALISASVVLASFASLVELPCTAGWPIIYTKILAERVFAESTMYYAYLALYNLIYVVPLTTIITLVAYYLKGRQITKEQMQTIKLVGGIVMIALGMVLLVNPELLMIV